MQSRYLTGNRLSWLAGLLEGEGSFVAGKLSKARQPRIAMAMTDRDIIEQVANMLDVSVGKRKSQHEHHKQIFSTEIAGGPVISLMKLLRSMMGARRQAQIDDAIACYKPLVRYPYRPFHLLEDQVEEHQRYWLAGYLEGEGWFGRHKYERKSGTRFYLSASVSSTDQDIIVRVKNMWFERYGAKISISSEPPPKHGTKHFYRMAVQGVKAAALMRDLYPLLGERRRAKIDEILQSVS
jgi:hypothetical protein